MHDYQNLFEYYDINHAFHYILSNYIIKYNLKKIQLFQIEITITNFSILSKLF